MTAHAETRDAQWCNAKWDEIAPAYVDAPVPDYGELLSRWNGIAAECKGTAIYEVRLASIHLMRKDPAAAQAVLRQVGKVSHELELTVDLVRLQADLDTVLARGSPSSDALDRFVPRFEALAKAHPDEAVVHEVSATFWLLRGDRARALASAERAVQLNPKSWWGYRQQAIAYSESKQYAAAVSKAEKAYDLHPAAAADADLMLALAVSFAALGNRKTTDTVLGLLLHHQPALRNTPQYREAIEQIQGMPATPVVPPR